MFCFYKFLKYSFVKQLQSYVSDTYILRNILNLINGEAGHHTHTRILFNLCIEKSKGFLCRIFLHGKIAFLKLFTMREIYE